MAELP